MTKTIKEDDEEHIGQTLTKLLIGQEEIHGNVTEIKGQLTTLNHRTSALEEKGHHEAGAKEEREKWENIERDRTEKKDSKQWKLLGFGIAGAGVLSASVIGVIEAGSR